MPEITEQTLERFKLILQTQLDEGLAGELANMPEVEIIRHSRFCYDSLVIMIKQQVLGQNLEVIRCEYPATWWDAVKQRWFPGWMKQRWPVDMTVEELRARAFYPLIPIKHYDSVINLQQMKWKETRDA